MSASTYSSRPMLVPRPPPGAATSGATTVEVGTTGVGYYELGIGGGVSGLIDPTTNTTINSTLPKPHHHPVDPTLPPHHTLTSTLDSSTIAVPTQEEKGHRYQAGLPDTRHPGELGTPLRQSWTLEEGAGHHHLTLEEGGGTISTLASPGRNGQGIGGVSSLSSIHRNSSSNNTSAPQTTLIVHNIPTSPGAEGGHNHTTRIPLYSRQVTYGNTENPPGSNTSANSSQSVACRTQEDPRTDTFDTGGRVTRVSSAPVRRPKKDPGVTSSSRWVSSNKANSGTNSRNTSGQYYNTQVGKGQGQHQQQYTGGLKCTQVRYERYNNNNLTDNVSIRDKTHGGHHTIGLSSNNDSAVNTRTNQATLSVVTPGLDGVSQGELNTNGDYPTKEDYEDAMLRHVVGENNAMTSDFVAGGAAIRPPEDLVRRHNLFKSNTSMDLRGGTHGRPHRQQYGGPTGGGVGGVPSGVPAGKLRGGSAGNADVNANNYWWMHTRDSINPHSVNTGGAAPSSSRPQCNRSGAYRELHVTLPSTNSNSSNSPRDDPLSPSKAQGKGRQSPTKQRPLGMTRGNEVFDNGVMPRVGVYSRLQSSSGVGRSFGVSGPAPPPATPNHNVHPRRVDPQGVSPSTAPESASYGQIPGGTPSRSYMPHEAAMQTSSAILNGDPMADRGAGLILPTQTGTANDKVHFQVVVQKGNSQKRFQISTRLEDIRRARETNHQATSSGSYRHLVKDPRGNKNSSSPQPPNGNFSYGRATFAGGSPSQNVPSGSPSGGSQFGERGHSHRVLQELAARYATVGEQEGATTHERERQPRRTSPSSKLGGMGPPPPQGQGQPPPHSSLAKHGGVIRYDNIASLETIANCLKDADDNHPPQNRPGTSGSSNARVGVSPGNSILKRKSRAPLLETPEVGWQQAIEGSNLTWSDYFCVSVGGDSPRNHHTPSPALIHYPHSNGNQNYRVVLGSQGQTRVGNIATGYPAHRGHELSRPELGRTTTTTVRPAQELAITPSVRSMTLMVGHKGNDHKDYHRNRAEITNRRSRTKRSVTFSTSNKVHEYNPDHHPSDSDNSAG